MSNVSYQRIRELLIYEEDTGLFTWKINVGKRGRAGCSVGSRTNTGYMATKLDGRSYQLHRIAWVYHYGEWPKYEIDHINGNRSDNRIINLRDVSRAMNQQNQRKGRIDSSHGFLGVATHVNKFSAKIQVNGKRIFLGDFENPEEAHEAYLAAKRVLHKTCSI